MARRLPPSASEYRRPPRSGVAGPLHTKTGDTWSSRSHVGRAWVAPDVSRTFGEREGAARGSFTLRASIFLLMPRSLWGLGVGNDPRIAHGSASPAKPSAAGTAVTPKSSPPPTRLRCILCRPGIGGSLSTSSHSLCLWLFMACIGLAALARGDRAAWGGRRSSTFLSTLHVRSRSYHRQDIGLGRMALTITDFARSVAVAAGLSIGGLPIHRGIRRSTWDSGSRPVSRPLLTIRPRVTVRHAGAAAAMAGSSMQVERSESSASFQARSGSRTTKCSFWSDSRRA